MRSRGMINKDLRPLEFAHLIIDFFVGINPDDAGLEMEMYHRPEEAYGLYQAFCRRYGIRPLGPLEVNLSGGPALFSQIATSWFYVNKATALSRVFIGLKISGRGYDDDDGGSYVAIEIVYPDKMPCALAEELANMGQRVGLWKR